MNETMFIMQQTADRADLEPGIVYKIRAFFQHPESEQYADDIDAWMHTRYANEHLFDLLLEEKHNGNFDLYMNMVLKKAKRRVNPLYRYGPSAAKWGLTIILGILILDLLIPSHPLKRLVFGINPPAFSFALNTVSTDSEAKTISLEDGTKIELQPHSMVQYPNALSATNRKLKITGSARLAVRGSLENPLQVEAGKYLVQTYNDALIRYEGGRLTVGKYIDEQK